MSVTLANDVYAAMKRDAEAWRNLLATCDRARSAASADVIAACEEWNLIARRPSFEQLQRRRGDTAARWDTPNPLDELFPRPRPLTQREQERASLMLDAALGAPDMHDQIGQAA